MTGVCAEGGDGTTSTEQKPSHAYTAPGRYTVSLVAANAGGGSTRTRPDYVPASSTDVPLDHWALDAILACADASIVQGHGDNAYRPSNAVTWDQMAVYVARAFDLPMCIARPRLHGASRPVRSPVWALQ